MKKFSLDILTPDRVIHSGYVKYVSIPEVDGEIMILPGHAPLIGELGIGIIKLETTNDVRKEFFCSGGFIDVTWENVTILANVVKEVDEIDRDVIERQRKEIMEKLFSSSTEYDYGELMKELKMTEYQLKLLERQSNVSG